MSIVVMERSFDASVSDEELGKMKEATQVCLDLNDVTLVQVYASADRKRFICIFEAPDVATVRRAVDATNIPYERVWAGDTLQ